MRIPQDATLDVKAAFQEVHDEIQKLQDRWVLADGSRITGAGDALTPTGLVTYRQLSTESTRLLKSVRDVVAVIDTMKLRNNLL